MKTNNNPHIINKEITNTLNELHDIAEGIHEDAYLDDIDGIIDDYLDCINRLVIQTKYLGEYREKLRREFIKIKPVKKEN